jgi:tRNA pseudouridine38-40 synthase
MTRYLFEIAYNGNAYHGWQRQPNAASIQEDIEDALFKLHSGKEISIVGCGRTDAGVHVKKYFFHADLPEISDFQRLIFKLNRMLSRNIVVFEIQKVSNHFHARFDATERTYRYFIHQQKNPFKEGFSLYISSELDFEKMNTAAQFLLGKKDFRSFSKAHSDVKTTVCEVYRAEWKFSEDEVFFEISANRFLRNMVRAVVGTLLDVGLGKLTIEQFLRVLEAQDRGEASLSVSAHGLFLWDVHYDS